MLNSQPSKTVQLSVGLMLGVSLDYIIILRFVLYVWIISSHSACAKPIHNPRFTTPTHQNRTTDLNPTSLIREHSWRHWVIYLTILWDILLYSSMICSQHWMVWYWSERRKVRNCMRIFWVGHLHELDPNYCPSSHHNPPPSTIPSQNPRI